MSLLTKAITQRIPKMYETEYLETPEKVAQVKLFLPGTAWTWYIVEYDGEDRCFGLVDSGYDNPVEFGYFSLKELSESKNSLGLGVERDRYFNPTVFEKIRV